MISCKLSRKIDGNENLIQHQNNVYIDLNSFDKTL